MGKSRVFDLMKQGETDEIEIMGETFVIMAPNLEDLLTGQQMSKALEEGDSKAVNLRAKLVMNCVLDTNRDPYFKKGDFDVVKSDRSGIVEKLLEAILGKIIDEKEVEDKKKK